MAIVTSSTSQISPANERLYHQSALLGDWKGNWVGNNQPVGFKVVNIRGNRAQVEYTHNGHTERGFGEVKGTLITFGGITVGTKDGKNMVLLFSVGNAGKQTANLEKQAPPASDSRPLTRRAARAAVSSRRSKACSLGWSASAISVRR